MSKNSHSHSHSHHSFIDQSALKIRLDKWLWVCRFYKTRSIAKQAIDSGKVSYQGKKPKKGKIIQIGDEVFLKQGMDEKTIIVLQISSQRSSATIAQTLYAETEVSIKQRNEKQRIRALSPQISHQKPTKKQRRQIHQFKKESF
jgi:ribosome-associated heat shock protein Hsp15